MSEQSLYTEHQPLMKETNFQHSSSENFCTITDTHKLTNPLISAKQTKPNQHKNCIQPPRFSTLRRERVRFRDSKSQSRDFQSQIKNSFCYVIFVT